MKTTRVLNDNPFVARAANNAITCRLSAAPKTSLSLCIITVTLDSKNEKKKQEWQERYEVLKISMRESLRRFSNNPSRPFETTSIFVAGTL